MAQILQILTMI